MLEYPPMGDYKETLNLPFTAFSMKANLPTKEVERLHAWEKDSLYQKIRQQMQGRPKFILHDGPPYANGAIHMGHAVNKVLKDIIVKSKTLSGFDAPFVPGWDCHGLPIELNVEKKLGKVSPSAFREACRKYAQEQVEIQKESFKRLGILADWEQPYLTSDFKFEANIIRALGVCIKQGHITQGLKPVHWCLECGSALAEAEVEYEQKTSTAIDVRFKLASANLVEKLGVSSHISSVGIVIWTTTPWTLPANEAVAVHPDITYSLIEAESESGLEYLILAEARVEACCSRYRFSNYRSLLQFPGKALAGLLATHPFESRQVPILLSAHVSLDAGTGAVHIAPAHGQEDYHLGLQYRLPIRTPIDQDGRFVESSLFPEKSVWAVNALVPAALKEALLAQEKITHSYPHCWRHKTPLIFLATPQWFLNMDRLREQAIKSVRSVSWLPTWGQERMIKMLDTRPDWCISRQRIWGVPLPLLVHKKTKALHPDTLKLIEYIANRFESVGVEAWYAFDPSDFIGAEEQDYEKITDILDVWFDSGVTHFSLLQKDPSLAYPADLYLEGSDQYRGWFQSSLLTSCAINGTAPYKTVLTHGFTVDEQGRKMSKSLGNGIAPEKVIGTWGADILRLWVASTDYRAEIAGSEKIIKHTVETYRRIRNTARFLLANLHDFEEKYSIALDQMLSLDRWILEEARLLQEEIIKNYETYQFHIIVQKIHQFCIEDLGGFYLDIIKDRQYTMPAQSLGRRSAQMAIYHIIQAMSCWLAPILSFTAEEIASFIPGATDSIFMSTWHQLPALAAGDPLEPIYHLYGRDIFWKSLLHIRAAVNKALEEARAEGKIGSALEAGIKFYGAPTSKAYHILKSLAAELHFIFITSEAEVLPLNAAEAGIAIKIADLAETIYLTIIPLADTLLKCTRCWHRRADVDQHMDYPGLCTRCIENISGSGEVRQYA